MPAMVWSARPDGHVDYYNERFYELTGAPRGEGGDSPWAGVLHPDDLLATLDRSRESMKSGEPVEMEVRIKDQKTGSFRWHLCRAVPARDRTGKIVRWFGTNTDIHERKQAEDQIRLLHSMTLAISEAEGLTDALAVILNAVCKATGWTLGQAWVPNHDGSALECSPAYGGALLGLEKFRAASERTTFARGQGLPGRVWQSKRPLWVRDLSRSDFVLGGPAAEVGLKAAVAIPVVAGEAESGFVGVVEFLATAARDEDAQIIALLATIGSQLGSLIRRKHAEETLKETEAQLRQAQKMEAIGQLAGGIAHDFNNVLTAISGYSELLLFRLHPGDPIARDLEQIKLAAKRAANLTRQLLAFSRKQVLQPRVLNVNTVIEEITSMLSRLVGESVNLVTALDGDVGLAKVDPGQLEQVLMNLAANARDAMSDCGTLTIETRNVVLDETYAREHAEVKPGAYVLIAVTDTGTGMTREVMARIFEPFFTTKPKDRGTGLGLSTVYGIVKQSGGHVWVYSEVGRGTTFKAYFPRVTEAEEPFVFDSGRFALSPRGDETVLLVEDDELVRELARTVLSTNGYRVLVASNGGEALLTCEQHSGKIHLVLTDVVMPQMTGRQLHERLSTARPGMKVMFMSGYAENAIVHNGVLDHGTNFIAKPFSPNDLVRAVRGVLDAGDARD